MPVKEPHKSKAQINKKRKDIKLLVICSEIPHTHILHHVTTIQLNFDKIQVTGFRKTRDTEQGISEQTPVIKFNKSELKQYSSDGKTHAKLS